MIKTQSAHRNILFFCKTEQNEQIILIKVQHFFKFKISPTLKQNAEKNMKKNLNVFDIHCIFLN
ncbi:hypothetical protein BpHYR1_047602 [Brachionus plicatilis]|uniref:Uncharacterized protein n=1 Tax=Brachionus plicatilis TaxID=10195 RepID=A0A3M7RSB5_BRAPC|nr:hypothetical protein BpHYR1_047602 [Brachionus plicatilis]